MDHQTTQLGKDLAKFRASISGQKATIPNFYTVFPGWTPNIHPEYERARDEVLNPWIERWVPDPHTARKFQKAEFGVFAAVICAQASFEKLCTVSKAFAWYFIWDDLFDCGCLAGDTKAARMYRERSMQYFRAVLCGMGPAPDLSDCSLELKNALHCWDEVAAHLRVECSRETLQVLMEKKLLYVSSVDTVDVSFQGKCIPSLTQYWRRRDRTAGVYPVIATIPFIYGLQVSWRGLNNSLMRLLWRHTSYLVHMINDVFSLRKELADNQIENMVPVLMLNEDVDCNQAVRLSHQLVQEAARGFLEVEDNFSVITGQVDSGISKAFIQGCKNVVMGLTHWSYSGERYFRNSELNENSEIEFTIYVPTQNGCDW
ncbi:terpene synthase family protein [Aspergillus lucknowensis]|uniref:Terpene synthase n=1 Tax=Aspergillus lucknowensis TaxID=176173 RepID=A0ABR4LIC4_9EURO